MKHNNNSTFSSSTCNTTNDGPNAGSGNLSSDSNEKNSEQLELTLGERRMRVKFQPGNNDKVHNIRERAAKRINRLEDMKTKNVHPNDKGELFRAIATAQTKTQEAAYYEELVAEFDEVD